MKKIIILTLALTLASLACVQSAAQPAAPGTSVPTVAVTPVTVQPAPTPSMCARVIASKSLNIRDADRDVIGWLRNGQTVSVLDGGGEWWMIRSNGVTGVVRASYLAPCEEK
jgi:uncharacterized protein YgiM (DUF1202 family)